MVSTRRKGREEAGPPLGHSGILYRVTLAEGRAQQDCCFLHLQGKGNEFNIAQRHAEELNTFPATSVFCLRSTLLHGLKLHTMPWQLSFQKVCPAYRVPPLKVMKATSQRDGSSPGDTLFFHSDGNMTFKMGPVCS